MMRKLVLIIVFVLIAGGGVAAQTCSVQSYFVSPDVDGVIETAIIQAIDGARKSIDIGLFSFTDDQLGDAVVRAARRGVTVRVILGVNQDNWSPLASLWSWLVPQAYSITSLPSSMGRW
jgi:phosphatidylserine/phosphatidylglycerophosphate/cardiolipin synthase-like enzyme